MKHPGIYTVHSVKNSVECTSVQIGGDWVPARPEGYPSWWFRFVVAWMVFTGKADAVVWPKGQ